MYADRLGQQENIKYIASGGVWGKHSKPKKFYILYSHPYTTFIDTNDFVSFSIIIINSVR
jgi:hypothetical protein